jgi:hypothetical protein
MTNAGRSRVCFHTGLRAFVTAPVAWRPIVARNVLVRSTVTEVLRSMSVMGEDRQRTVWVIQCRKCTSQVFDRTGVLFFPLFAIRLETIAPLNPEILRHYNHL